MTDGGPKPRSLPALAGCAAVGALAAGIPFALFRRYEDPLGAPFQPPLLYVVQFAAFGALWRLCASRRVPWLSFEWSPWALSFVGSVVAYVVHVAAFVVGEYPGPPTLKDFAGALVVLFWFWGWIPTFLVGFVGGAWVGVAALRSKPRETE